MTISSTATLIKDFLEVKIPQWYNSVTGSFVEVSDEHPLPTNNLVYKKPIDTYFSRDTGTTANVAVAITSQDRSFTVDNAAPFAVNDFIAIRENGVFEDRLKIIDIASNVITLNRPIDFSYTTAATIYEIDYNMAVDGSSTPVAFRITPPTTGPNEIYQLTKMNITMTHSGAADDTTFGDIAGANIVNGIIVRVRSSDQIVTSTSWFKNGDIKDDMFDVEYSQRAPAGNYGTNGQWTLSELEVIVELVGGDNDYAEILIQDPLQTLIEFKIKAQGRIVVQ